MQWIAEHMDHADGDCLLWPFSCCQNGYAMAGSRGYSFYVHRFMCERRNGPPPSSKHHAAHECGNTRCVNPQHLTWKTNAENQRDRRRHGTYSPRRGKLNATQVETIRALKGHESAGATARRFGVTDATIRQIRSSRIWANTR